MKSKDFRECILVVGSGPVWDTLFIFNLKTEISEKCSCFSHEIEISKTFLETETEILKKIYVLLKRNSSTLYKKKFFCILSKINSSTLYN